VPLILRAARFRPRSALRWRHQRGTCSAVYSARPAHTLRNALFSILRSGCAWCFRPPVLPAWQTVSSSLQNMAPGEGLGLRAHAPAGAVAGPPGRHSAAECWGDCQSMGQHHWHRWRWRSCGGLASCCCWKSCPSSRLRSACGRVPT